VIAIESPAAAGLVDIGSLLGRRNGRANPRPPRASPTRRTRRGGRRGPSARGRPPQTPATRERQCERAPARCARYGPGTDDHGPFYAYEQQGEDFNGWRDRVHSDITWGQTTLADHISTYQPLAFAPPYGSYGQDGTNDSRIPDDLLVWLSDRYDAVFTQDVNARTHTGAGQPLGRIQVTRATTGGDLYEKLLSGEA
jgi:hypothetical protein